MFENIRKLEKLLKIYRILLTGNRPSIFEVSIKLQKTKNSEILESNIDIDHLELAKLILKNFIDLKLEYES